MLRRRSLVGCKLNITKGLYYRGHHDDVTFKTALTVLTCSETKNKPHVEW